ncbi:MAG: hypothetical protein O9267_05335 [Flavobacterium sp.]|uniref:hypothetical protein n=1 Tax=Flavobacterium sp. TaxID=239 RepID=UPI0022C9009E|nr:hypothetical protein [Flavobacterium sp.]MCZ8197007.1 hypothetical protein [Flavobacterium sp.]
MEKITLKLKYIGFYQLVGGIVGILNTIRFLPNLTQVNGGIFLILLLIFALYSYSIYCGYLLIKKRNIKGINYSIYNQLIQIIGFGVLGFAFHFTAGIYTGIKLNLTNDTILTFMFGHSAAMININSNPEFTELSLNIIALILLNLILNLKSKIEKIEEVEN